MWEYEVDINAIITDFVYLQKLSLEMGIATYMLIHE